MILAAVLLDINIMSFDVFDLVVTHLLLSRGPGSFRLHGTRERFVEATKQMRCGGLSTGATRAKPSAVDESSDDAPKSQKS